MKTSPIILGILISSTVVGLAAMPQQIHALPKPTLVHPLPKPTITEITLQRTPCYGTCPNYTVILRSDGTATYRGGDFAERKGTYKAYIYGFEQLAKIIEARKYFSFSAVYTKPVSFSYTEPVSGSSTQPVITTSSTSDSPGPITTSVVRNGKRKTVENYENFGPIELWEIETLINGLIANARWEKVSN